MKTNDHHDTTTPNKQSERALKDALRQPSKEIEAFPLPDGSALHVTAYTGQTAAEIDKQTRKAAEVLRDAYDQQCGESSQTKTEK